MSIAEAERFVGDLAKNPQLLAQVKPEATGLASVVALAKKHGYNFSLDEAKKYVQSKSPRELTDKQLDAIAGGKHHGGGGSSVATSTKVAQTAYVASSAVEAAEVATTAVQVAEAAADVAAAAEAVVVVAAVLI
jgi:predicted ribosomally synthesized peptide with nif11-like leader